MDHAEFDLLVDRHLDGGLDQATQDRLEALLCSDASLRTRFWDLARIHGQISWVAQERHADLPADEAVAADRALRDSSTQTPIARTATRRPTNRTIQTSPGLWRRVIPTAVAACVAVAAGFAWLSSNAAPVVQASTDAVIADLADAHWQGGIGPKTGDAVGNRTLRLESGLAQVRFASGATVILNGPATFTARSARGGKLDQGRVVARVPESAKGFTIESDIARVVDLGTEFGFAAGDVQQQVAVFDGLVQVFATHSPIDLPQALHRGEAVNVDSHGAIAATAFDEKTFTRAMPAELASPLLSRGLLAWWKLDETDGTTIHDASDNQRDGVLQFADAKDLHVAGMVGGALHFRDTAYIEVPHRDDLNLTQMTLHAWVRPDDKQRIDAQIISKRGSYGLAMPRNDAMKFYFWDMDRVIDRPFVPGKWVNLCATFDGGIRRFYVDGVRIASITSPTPPPTTQSLRIGGLYGGTTDFDRYFQGTIDEVRIYNRALSDDEVRFLHLQAARPR
jgi:Concanavalin A-like lectin/glucanases superfamily/FecR protein